MLSKGKWVYPVVSSIVCTGAVKLYVTTVGATCILGQVRIAMGSGEMDRNADSARKGTRTDTQRAT